MNFLTLRAQNFLLAIYSLSIRSPYPPYPPIESFTFPLSPQRVRKTFNSMSAAYDTMGSAAQAGINRQIDRYGMTPFMYEIDGTTGWDFHLTDGFQYSGMAAINRLIDMFYLYDTLNAEQQATNNPNTYIMEWSDFFNGEFYQVEPFKDQSIEASDRAPLLQYYRLRLIGVQPIAAPIEDISLLADPILQILEGSLPENVANILQFSSTIASNY